MIFILYALQWWGGREKDRKESQCANLISSSHFILICRNKGKVKSFMQQQCETSLQCSSLMRLIILFRLFSFLLVDGLSLLPSCF